MRESARNGREKEKDMEMRENDGRERAMGRETERDVNGKECVRDRERNGETNGSV